MPRKGTSTQYLKLYEDSQKKKDKTTVFWGELAMVDDQAVA